MLYDGCLRQEDHLDRCRPNVAEHDGGAFGRKTLGNRPADAVRRRTISSKCSNPQDAKEDTSADHQPVGADLGHHWAIVGKCSKRERKSSPCHDLGNDRSEAARILDRNRE